MWYWKVSCPKDSASSHPIAKKYRDLHCLSPMKSVTRCKKTTDFTSLHWQWLIWKVNACRIYRWLSTCANEEFSDDDLPKNDTQIEEWSIQSNFNIVFQHPVALISIMSFNIHFHHNATQDCYRHFNLYSQHVLAAYSHLQVSSLC
jgi:hypothetical protein